MAAIAPIYSFFLVFLRSLSPFFLVFLRRDSQAFARSVSLDRSPPRREGVIWECPILGWSG